MWKGRGRTDERGRDDRKARAEVAAGHAHRLPVWLLLGLIGAHRFYLGRIGSGVLMLLVTSVTVAKWSSGGVLLAPCIGLWPLIDALVLPGMVRNPPGWQRGLEGFENLGGPRWPSYTRRRGQ